MSHRGRPPVLNEIKKAKILAVLSTGCSRRTAALYVGCDPKSIYNTALRDPQFELDLMHHESAPEIQNLINIRNAGKEPRYWRASAWLLERTNREYYGVRDLDTVTKDELSRFTSTLMEMLVEEVPVAKYRKRILARIQEMLDDDPKVLEARYRRGKYSYSKPGDFPKISQDSSPPTPEKHRIPLVPPEGSIPEDAESGENGENKV